MKDKIKLSSAHHVWVFKDQLETAKVTSTNRAQLAKALCVMALGGTSSVVLYYEQEKERRRGIVSDHQHLVEAISVSFLFLF
jgi:phage terminase large subunit-like protein